MFEPVLEQFGLAKNEALIYEVLLREGESSVAVISRKSSIHRRNVYDSLQRLMEKGLVFEAFSRNENLYRGVSPQKFEDMWGEKKQVLDRSMPHMMSLFESVPQQTELYEYRGMEGWKNYMRDILSTGKDFYCIGGKGGWLDPRVKDYLPIFLKGVEENQIKMHHLFDAEVEKECPEILKYVGDNYKFLPSQFSTQSSIDICGDRVLISSQLETGQFSADDFTLTVIINPQVADAFRTWFRFMWEGLK